MTIRFFTLIFLFGLTAYGQQGKQVDNKIQKVELFGKHWAGSCTNSCDTLYFSAFKKYDSKRYQWGGDGEGLEFYKDGTAQTFSNVMCSDESSPVELFPSKWKLQRDTLTIDGYYITKTYQILILNKRNLQMKILGINAKEIK